MAYVQPKICISPVSHAKAQQEFRRAIFSSLPKKRTDLWMGHTQKLGRHHLMPATLSYKIDLSCPLEPSSKQAHRSKFSQEDRAAFLGFRASSSPPPFPVRRERQISWSSSKSKTDLVVIDQVSPPITHHHEDASRIKARVFLASAIMAAIRHDTSASSGRSVRLGLDRVSLSIQCLSQNNPLWHVQYELSHVHW